MINKLLAEECLNIPIIGYVTILFNPTMGPLLERDTWSSFPHPMKMTLWSISPLWMKGNAKSRVYSALLLTLLWLHIKVITSAMKITMSYNWWSTNFPTTSDKFAPPFRWYCTISISTWLFALLRLRDINVLGHKKP